jgi:hypothetical protein
MWDSFFHVDYAGTGLQAVIRPNHHKTLANPVFRAATNNKPNSSSTDLHHHEIYLYRYFGIVRLVLPSVLCGCWRMRRFVTLDRSPASSICWLPCRAVIAPMASFNNHLLTTLPVLFVFPQFASRSWTMSRSCWERRRPTTSQPLKPPLASTVRKAHCPIGKRRFAITCKAMKAVSLRP